MGRLKVGTVKTLEEVEAECPAWKHGCTCHVCRILNGAPEPKIERSSPT